MPQLQQICTDLLSVRISAISVLPCPNHSLIQSQAALAEQQTTSLARLSVTDKELAELRRESIELRRENEERFARIEAILLRHEQILQGVPEAIREKIGFKQTD